MTALSSAAGALGLWCCFQSPATFYSCIDTHVSSASRLWCLTGISVLRSSRMELLPCQDHSWSLVASLVFDSLGVCRYSVNLCRSDLKQHRLDSSTSKCGRFQTPFAVIMETGSHCSWPWLSDSEHPDGHFPPFAACLFFCQSLLMQVWISNGIATQ